MISLISKTRFLCIAIAGIAANCAAVDALMNALVPEVKIVLPEDAGWPRDPSKITRNSRNDFTVDPDGHAAYLMVEITNPAAVTQQVKLRGFTDNFAHKKPLKKFPPASDDEAYLYIQPADGAWQRVYPEIQKTNYPFGPWLINAPPGRTRVSTVVSFTHQDYINYVNSLSDTDPRISKKVVLESGNGRFKTYRIDITNPKSTNTHKLKIAFCKTSHAYEKSGFFMAQGVIAWLLSGDPAANLDHIRWSIYPCLDSQATHDGMNYNEQADLIVDDGRKRGTANDNSGALWDARTGELPSQHYHVLTDLHMYEMQDWASYKYNDPTAPPDVKGNGHSDVERVMLAFWPYWYEFGIDNYEHENKWQAANSLPKHFGDALVTHLEIPFYGKDDIDPRQRLRDQGRLWARSHSQAFLQMQREHHFWTEKSPGGAVTVDDATILPPPKITLLEELQPTAGKVSRRKNAAGQPMRLYHEIYEHGLGMKAGDSATYEVPADVNSFCAMTSMDDAQSIGTQLIQFVITSGNKELWRSRKLARGERELAYIALNNISQITLRIEGSSGTLANWGGAKFTTNDPEVANQSPRDETGKYR